MHQSIILLLNIMMFYIIIFYYYFVVLKENIDYVFWIGFKSVQIKSGLHRKD